ncbi:MAG: hypothetical protein U0797_13090 [Gemmataceae bacterium]
MSRTTLSDAPQRTALQSCVATLKRLAEFRLDPALDQRQRQLGEQKEFLDPEQHAELLALVAFSEQRTIEKLEAQAALQRLRAAFPDLDERAL